MRLLAGFLVHISLIQRGRLKMKRRFWPKIFSTDNQNCPFELESSCEPTEYDRSLLLLSLYCSKTMIVLEITKAHCMFPIICCACNYPMLTSSSVFVCHFTFLKVTLFYKKIFLKKFFITLMIDLLICIVKLCSLFSSFLLCI